MRDAVIINYQQFCSYNFFLRNRKTKKMFISLFSENVWEMIKDLQLQQIISVDA